ncbi:DUF885 domain-containing protein [Fulvivirga ligni]|uniref:DUF885 domain-containing protein n=1 Tax=Fulvivirga ligni TaxID=2904246 RepID=UPI001F212BD0|nr:DUF885 domain-containing protein [Fulvivirga ligni]UII20441.1 DUF885 domain-containing protein [Fulvivirga ligni]
MKLTQFYCFIGLVLMISACNSPKDNSSEVESKPDISKVYEDYYQDRLKFYPLEATSAGDNRYNDTLPNNISQEYLSQLKSFYENYQQKLAEFDKSSLSATDQLSYDILEWECNINLEGLKFTTELTPLDQFWSLQIMMGQYASGASAQPFKTEDDYDNWLKRVDDFMVWCDTAMVNMTKGMETGWVLPATLTKKVIPQIAELDHGPVEEHLFFSPVKNLPESFNDDQKEKYTAAYKSMVEEKVIPTFKKLHSFLEEKYLPASRTTSGASALPNGDEYYSYRIKQFTTTELSADSIFNLGMSEVKRISSEMEEIKNDVGFTGDLKSFFNYVRTNKEMMPYDSAPQVIAHFNDIYTTMKPQLKNLFDLVPKTPFEVRRTEAFREASASAEYNPGSIDGTRPGIFYVPVPDAAAYNIFSDESLFLHEAIPGHHYQISLQQENDKLPEFRKTLWYSAYGEGWALYSESLGKELGLYIDPYQYFGMLSAEMHRAIRLVVDAGMHSKGWTREQAIQFSLENEAESEASIISEIERYMAMPGQALSYKIGQLTIWELRAKAHAEIGPDFDVKKFHNQVLESGCVPLALLEAKINQWIENEKQ